LLIITLIALALRLVKTAITGVLQTELLLGGGNQPEIMFSVLEIALGLHMIASGLRVAAELEIFLRNILGGAANFDVGTIRFIGSRQRIWPFTAASTPPVSAPHAIFLMVRSHRESLVCRSIPDRTWRDNVVNWAENSNYGPDRSSYGASGATVSGASLMALVGLAPKMGRTMLNCFRTGKSSKRSSKRFETIMVDDNEIVSTRKPPKPQL
jgi:hypothetical protein